MTQPSTYESAAWADIQRFRGRPASRVLHSLGDRVAEGAGAMQARLVRLTDEHEQVRAVRGVVARGFRAAGNGARAAGGAIPAGVRSQAGEWGQAAVGSVTRTAVRLSRAGLSPQRVVRRYRAAGHDVDSLVGIRALDLEHVDQVRGRGLDWYYPAVAALSGAGAGLAITGGQIAIVASAGAAAAPGAGVLTSAVVLDSTAVLGLASRAVGHVALCYGYDPDVPAEKVFVLSVVNAGTALSASAKSRAMAEVARLTQQLYRGAAWKVLDQALVTRLAQQLASRYGVRLTKQSLGKVVPAAGIVLGASFNWTTLESIVDAADVAYRRRFLLEKYPQLAEHDAPVVVDDPVVGDEQDEEISVLAELVDVGGPDLRPEGNDDPVEPPLPPSRRRPADA